MRGIATDPLQLLRKVGRTLQVEGRGS